VCVCVAAVVCVVCACTVCVGVCVCVCVCVCVWVCPRNPRREHPLIHESGKMVGGTYARRRNRGLGYIQSMLAMPPEIDKRRKPCLAASVNRDMLMSGR